MSPLTTVRAELARYILFSLTEKQKALVSRLKICDPSAITNVDPIISDVDRTRQSATRCLEDLAARADRPVLQTPRLTFQQRASLSREYQNLCPSAAQYRDGLVSHSQLGTLSVSRRELSCNECGARIMPHKTEVPIGDGTSWVIISISGLLRSHCHAGSGWACIWQPQTPPCFGIFRDEKALLMHMIDAHIRDEGEETGIQVDWPADHRRGDIDKCGFMVRVDGMMMQNVGGSLVVPRRAGWTASPDVMGKSRPGMMSRTSSTSTATSQWAGSDASSTMIGSLPEMQ